MINWRLWQTFRKGSRTYFYSSLFFPSDVRRDVFVLYSFVRVMDDFIDKIPQQTTRYFDHKRAFYRAADGLDSPNAVIRDYAELAERKEFDPDWTQAFLHAMETDLDTGIYADIAAVERYIYGSAEVIGLMMAQVLGLPPASHRAARMLGKAMQYINFIRDIREDIDLGRIYMPQDELRAAGLADLSEAEARRKPDAFAALIRRQIARYDAWQAEAEAGFHFIPRRYRIPIQTASDMYNWIARRIAADPFVVYARKVKPTRSRVVGRIFKNAFLPVAAVVPGLWL